MASKEKMRRCLGYECGVMFKSSSPANRFCKKCLKKRSQTVDGLPPLNLDELPPDVAKILDN